MALSVLFPLYDYFLKKIATSDGIEITAGLLNNEILIFAGVFFIAAFWLAFSLRRQFRKPSRLFQGSLGELEQDIAQLRDPQ